MNLGSPPELNITGSFTLSAWIKISSATSFGSIVSWGEHSTHSDRTFWIKKDTGKVALYFYPTSTNMVVGTTDLRDNEWHYVTGVWDGTSGHVYVDGTLENSGNLTAGSYTYTGTYIGRNIGGDYFLNGSISDIRIFDYALTQTEIQDNMNNDLTVNETGLKAYYKLDSGSGATAADSAGSNDGTINGATWAEK